MAVKLHALGLERAKKLIQADEVETFDANWNEEKPATDEVVHFINTHTMSEYGQWFLGVNDAYAKDTKEHYVYPYGDLKEVQRCALVHTIDQAKKNNDGEIIKAAQELLALVDKKKC